MGDAWLKEHGYCYIIRMGDFYWDSIRLVMKQKAATRLNRETAHDLVRMYGGRVVRLVPKRKAGG